VTYKESGAGTTKKISENKKIIKRGSDADLHSFQCGSRSRDLITKNCKFYSLKIAIYFIPRSSWKASKLQEKPPALKKNI
jgi:hypothetical protein